MKKNDDLFELIKSLTKSEKKYFQQFSSIQGREKKKDYIILFEALSKQKTYDEVKLKVILARNQCKNELRHVKNYLHNQLLRALQAYHHDSGKYEEIKFLLSCARIMHRKGLYSNCKKLIKKAKTIAINHDFFGDLVDIHNWEIRLMYNTQDFSNRDELFKEVNELAKNIENTRFYQNKVADTHAFHLLDRRVRSKERFNELQKIITGIPEDISNAQTYTAKENFYRLFSTVYGMINEPKKNLRVREEIVALMESNEFLIKEERSNYVLATSNLVIGLVDSREYERALKILDKIIVYTHEIDNKSLQTNVYFNLYDLRLNIYLSVGNIEQMHDTLQKIEDLFFTTEFGALDAFRMSLATTAMFSYFVLKDYSSVLRWANQLLSHKKSNIGLGNYGKASILDLLSHYELGNREQLIYYVKNTLNNLKKIDQLNALELAVIKFIKKVAVGKSKQHEKELLIELKAELIGLSKADFEKYRFESFIYLAWLDHKILGTPIKKNLLYWEKEIGKLR